MKWDYFISHASEDKEIIAAPLAHYLKSADFSVWYDEFTLKLGDSLLSSIDSGLSQSRFGVTILSPAFFAKKWPRQELAGLIATEHEAKRILPVWHNVDSIAVARVSPILADRKAISTSKGLQAVAEAIVTASFPKRLSKLPLSTAEATTEQEELEAQNVLKTLLDSGASTQDIYLYLSSYHVLISRLVGYHPIMIPGFKLPQEIQCDFAFLVPHGITGPMQLILVILGPVSDLGISEMLTKIDSQLGRRVRISEYPANDYLGAPYVGEFPTLAPLSTSVTQLVSSNNIHFIRPKTWSFSFWIVSGRRDIDQVPERDMLSKQHKMKLPVASQGVSKDKDGHP